MTLMSPGFKKVVLALLEDYSNKLSNSSCNDFELDKHVPDVAERRELMKKFYKLNGSPEDFDPNGQYDTVMDYMMLALFEEYVK